MGNRVACAANHKRKRKRNDDAMKKKKKRHAKHTLGRAAPFVARNPESDLKLLSNFVRATSVVKSTLRVVHLVYRAVVYRRTRIFKEMLPDSIRARARIRIWVYIPPRVLFHDAFRNNVAKLKETIFLGVTVPPVNTGSIRKSLQRAAQPQP